MSAAIKWKATLTVLATIVAMAALFLVWGWRHRQADMNYLLAEHGRDIATQLASAARSLAIG